MYLHRPDISLAAARRAFDRHLSVAGAARELMTYSKTVDLRLDRTAAMPKWHRPERYIDALHRSGMTLAEIRSRHGISERGAANAIRRANGLPQIGA